MGLLRGPWRLLAVLGALLAAISYSLAYYFVSNSDAFTVSSQFLRTNAEVIRVAGQIQDLSLSWTGMKMRVSGDSGRAELTIKIRGSISAPRAYLELHKRGIWEITFARLLPESGPAVVLKETARP